MLDSGKVSEEERDAELRNHFAGVRLELRCVSRIVLRRKNLHRDGNLINIAFREKRWVADGNTIDQRGLVLAGSKAEYGPPAVTEPDCTNKGICELDLGSASSENQAPVQRCSNQFLSENPAISSASTCRYVDTHI